MRGDFSRDTFDPLRHFSRVLVQQGRLQMDADSNEQSDILLHYLRTLATDLIGGHAGPGDGFEIAASPGSAKLDFMVLPGRYYVDGVLCENDNGNLSYATQSGYSSKEDELPDGKRSLVYLDVWERHVTALDDDAIREVALGQADTTSRAQVMWQVRALSRLNDNEDLPQFDVINDWREWLGTLDGMGHWFGQWPPKDRGYLKAKGRGAATGETTPCVISPEARFRGLENQLYRVEIHRGGPLGTATFKWSRNNGSDVVAVKSLNGSTVTLASWGRGDREDFAVNDCVEIVEDGTALRGMPGRLAMVIGTNPDDFTVTLKPVGSAALPAFDAAACVAKHVQLRRWDHRLSIPGSGGNKPQPAEDGALQVEEDRWLALEDGVQVMFGAPEESAFEYLAGDYWIIPARTATGDVEWPGPLGQPELRPPRGVRHFYAPLAVVNVVDGKVKDIASLRNTLNPIGAA